ncbi:Holliday junction recognition protein [Rhynchonycteris naso]
MEGEFSAEHALQQSLRDSHQRFQRRMQQLLEKYNQPFEDDPLVQMSTLTYRTRQGLRVWGGRLITKISQDQIQGSPVKTVGGNDGPGPALASGDELPTPGTQDLGEARTSLPCAPTITPAPLSPHPLRTPGTSFWLPLLTDSSGRANWVSPVPCSEHCGGFPLRWVTSRIQPVPDLNVTKSEHSDADASWSLDDVAVKALTPTVPWSPLKDDLRRKYMSQVDLLLRQDEGCSQLSDDGGGTDTRVSVVSSLVWPPGPARGHRGHVSEGSPPEPAVSSHPCSADMAVVPRNDSVLWQEASGNSFSSSQTFVADGICNVTISDLYAGMLCSMSRLLSAKPSRVISTKTVRSRGRSLRRRPRSRAALSRTYCGGGRRARARRGSRDAWRAEQECLDFRDLPGHREAGLESGRAVLEVPKLQVWEELKRTPQKLWSSASLDSRAPPSLSREKRVMTLQWLISPVKIVPRPRRPWGEGWRPKELGSRLHKLHQEYSLSPRRQPSLPCLPYSASPANMGTGGPESPRGLETHRPTRPFCRAKAKSLREAFENLGKQAVDSGWCPPKGDPSVSLTKTHLTRTLGRSEPTADLFQGNHLGMYRKSASLSEASSLPRVQSPDSVRDHYHKIKEKFDRLHQKCCQKSPPWTKEPFHTRASPNKAGVQVQKQREGFSGKFNPDSGFRDPRKLSPAPHWSSESLLGSTAIDVRPSPRFPLPARCSPPPRGKRSRSPDPQGCGRWRPDSQDPFRMVGRTVLRPGEEAGSFQPNSGKKPTGRMPSTTAFSPARLWGPPDPPGSPGAS